MIKSMTGYGREIATVEGYDISVEIKSVNHRYFEFSSRIPRAYGYIDDKLKSLIQSRVSRGKIDVGVTVYRTDGGEMKVEINETLAENYVCALRLAAKKLGIRGGLRLTDVSRLPDIFSLKRETEDEEKVWQCVKLVCDRAIDKFIDMRTKEGEKLKSDVLSRLATIEELVSFVEERSPKTVAEYRERLYQKIQEILGDSKIDESRILTEAAIYGEKIAVDEETVRLRSHIKQYRDILESDEPVGRKLDFLTQELNREANTIGSKCNDIDITKTVVEIKSEIEKIREQIQNME